MPEQAVYRATKGSWFRDRAWSRAVQALKGVPGNDLPLDLAQRLIRAWGDEATAVSPEYLAQCFKAARTATGTIVDFGAGVTTIVMALACRDRPASVLAIEHDPHRRRRVLSELSRVSRRSGDVRLAPVDPRDDVPWAATDLQSIRRPIAFAACHAVRGLGNPREAWRRIVEPALLDKCAVYFDPA